MSGEAEEEVSDDDDAALVSAHSVPDQDLGRITETPPKRARPSVREWKPRDVSVRNSCKRETERVEI